MMQWIDSNLYIAFGILSLAACALMVILDKVGWKRARQEAKQSDQAQPREATKQDSFTETLLANQAFTETMSQVLGARNTGRNKPGVPEIVTVDIPWGYKDAEKSVALRNLSDAMFSLVSKQAREDPNLDIAKNPSASVIITRVHKEESAAAESISAAIKALAEEAEKNQRKLDEIAGKATGENN